MVTATTDPDTGGNRFSPAFLYSDIAQILEEGSEAASSSNSWKVHERIDSGWKVLRFDAPGTYYISQIVLDSGCSVIVGEGVTLKKPSAYFASMFINRGALESTPTRNANISFAGSGCIDGNAENQSQLTQAVSGYIPANSFLYGIQGEIAMIGVDGFEFSNQRHMLTGQNYHFNRRQSGKS